MTQSVSSRCGRICGNRSVFPRVRADGHVIRVADFRLRIPLRSDLSIVTGSTSEYRGLSCFRRCGSRIVATCWYHGTLWYRASFAARSPRCCLCHGRSDILLLCFSRGIRRSGQAFRVPFRLISIVRDASASLGLRYVRSTWFFVRGKHPLPRNHCLVRVGLLRYILANTRIPLCFLHVSARHVFGDARSLFFRVVHRIRSYDSLDGIPEVSYLRRGCGDPRTCGFQFCYGFGISGHRLRLPGRRISLYHFDLFIRANRARISLKNPSTRIGGIFC